MTENLPKLKKQTDIQVQESQKVPNKIHPKRSTPKHIIKLSTVKKRILKAVREKQLVKYKGTTIILSADSSAETL